MRTHRNGNWFGLLVMVVGIVYLLADLAKTFSPGISGWTTFFLLAGIWLFHNSRKELTD
ncbi:MAG: hypothetical protein JW705_03905 [Methanosarcinaceae archaeon]|nr:hypothetical protein [Methanosarcinaceae archaeon]